MEVGFIYAVHKERLTREELRNLKGDIRKRREELEALDGERAAIKEEVKIARNKLINLMCYSKNWEGKVL